jgi:methylmalonyl-CoA/ethylmalonyl-CoA epimerase
LEAATRCEFENLFAFSRPQAAAALNKEDIMSDLMADLAPHFGQISYVVADMESAQQWFKQVFGVKYFGVADFELGPAMNVKVKGVPAQFKIKLALSQYGKNGELELELIQPLSGMGPHMEHLRSKGPGLHHVAFFVPDFERFARRFVDSGCPMVLEGEGDGVHFAYFDCLKNQGAFVELTQFSPAAWENNNRMKNPPQ